MDPEQRGSEEEQAVSPHSQPSVGDQSIAASGPNVGQPNPAMDEQFMAQMGEFMRRLVGAIPPPAVQPVIPVPPPMQKSVIERARKYGAEDFKD